MVMDASLNQTDPHQSVSLPDLPFRVEVRRDSGVIVLSGDLDGTAQVRGALANLIGDASVRDHWKVDASEARVLPEGVEAWIGLTTEQLRECRLEYGPSQLAMILQFDPTYSHAHSEFEQDLRSGKD